MQLWNAITTGTHKCSRYYSREYCYVDGCTTKAFAQRFKLLLGLTIIRFFFFFFFHFFFSFFLFLFFSFVFSFRKAECILVCDRLTGSWLLYYYPWFEQRFLWRLDVVFWRLLITYSQRFFFFLLDFVGVLF